MNKYRLLVAAALCALMGLLATPLAAHAANNMRSGTVTSVGKDETIDGSAYLAGTSVTVAGTVRGDLYCAGQNIDVTGTVEGDVICAGQTISVSGNVLGDVRVAGQTVTIASPVAHNVTAFGQSVTLTGNAVINSDATIFGSTVQLGGKVGRDATVGGQMVTLAGTVGRTVTSTADQLTLSSGARVGGGLDYTSHKQAQVDQGATVTGQTVRHEPSSNHHQKQSSWASGFWMAVYWFGALLVFGLVLLGFMPRTYRTASQLMIRQGGWALLSGIVNLIMTPIVVILLMVTVIGIPVGVALLFLWLISLVAAFAYSGYTVGEWIMAQASWKLKWPGLWALVVGLVILALLMLVPVVGGLFGFLALIWGLGGITLSVGRYLKTRDTDLTAKKTKA